MIAPQLKRAADEAFRHAAAREKQLLRDYPDAWRLLDKMRAERPMQWPDWCLLPMGAATAVATSRPAALQPNTIAVMSALYAWQFSRSVWLIEPGLTSRLLTQVPDALTVQDLAGLPEWCVYIAAAHPEWPGSGLWAHLEHDVNTGRPELRLLLDVGDTPMPVPIYLDRGSVVEALADYRDTALASRDRTGTDVHGAVPDAAAARLADNVDGYLGILSYLARPEADIVHGTRPSVRPIKPRRPKRDRDVWLVGYSNIPEEA
ncbi:hypothetical protein [Actinomadura sp. 3N407]|uniref:hypothetical protein n=1 Tax=Actinomadura sp. 3N407 TaxID=3457423 RepID=UPI003FCC7F36